MASLRGSAATEAILAKSLLRPCGPRNDVSVIPVLFVIPAFLSFPRKRESRTVGPLTAWAFCLYNAAMPLNVVILAAGKGTRMKSDLLKVAHLAAGRPLVEYVIEAVSHLPVDKIYLIVGHQSERLRRSIKHPKVVFVEQAQQKGTGHAVLQAKKYLAHKKGDTLVLNGDIPLITPATIKSLVETHRGSNTAATLLTADLPDPSGYGRIVRGAKGSVTRIVEHKDARSKELRLKEINVGTYVFRNRDLFKALGRLKPANVQKEYYLTDVIAILKGWQLPVVAYKAPDHHEVQGVNTRQELAQVGRVLYQRNADHWMLEGVTIIDPKSTYIDSTAKLAPDVMLYPFTFLRGQTAVGADSQIGPYTTVIDSVIGRQCQVRNSDLEDCRVKDSCSINFSCLEKSTLKPGSRVPPFSYLKNGRSISKG